jgi:hypothetical protein
MVPRNYCESLKRGIALSHQWWQIGVFREVQIAAQPTKRSPSQSHSGHAGTVGVDPGSDRRRQGGGMERLNHGRSGERADHYGRAIPSRPVCSRPSGPAGVGGQSASRRPAPNAAAAIAVSLILAGCASPEYHQQQAAGATPVKLCEAYYYGPADVQRAAAYEVERRRMNCNDFRNEAALMYQQRMQGSAASDALSRQLLAPRPAIIQPPRQINCTSYRAGNTVQTNCN